MHEELSGSGVTLKLLDHCQDRENYYLILPYMKGGELLDVMNKTENPSAQTIKKWFLPFVKAVEYAHTRNIILLDMKPENAIADAQGNFWICDFGYSMNLEHGRTLNMCRGTPEYFPPEMIAPRCEFDRGADLWNLGAILYLMLTKQYAFSAPDSAVDNERLECISRQLKENRRNHGAKWIMAKIKTATDYTEFSQEKKELCELACRLMMPYKQGRLGYENIGDLTNHKALKITGNDKLDSQAGSSSSGSSSES